MRFIFFNVEGEMLFVELKTWIEETQSVRENIS